MCARAHSLSLSFLRLSACKLERATVVRIHIRIICICYDLCLGLFHFYFRKFTIFTQIFLHVLHPVFVVVIVLHFGCENEHNFRVKKSGKASKQNTFLNCDTRAQHTNNQTTEKKGKQRTKTTKKLGCEKKAAYKKLKNMKNATYMKKEKE